MEFHHLSTSPPRQDTSTVNFTTPKAASLSNIVDSFVSVSEMSMWKLQHCELGYFARELDNFLFGDKPETGACYHQYRVDTMGQSIPKADFYERALNTSGYPNTPIVLGDMKMQDLDMAIKETAGYCVKAMEVYSGEKKLQL